MATEAPPIPPYLSQSILASNCLHKVLITKDFASMLIGMVTRTHRDMLALLARVRIYGIGPETAISQVVLPIVLQKFRGRLNPVPSPD